MTGASRRFRRQQQRPVRLIPVPQLALGPAPTIAELRHEGGQLFADRAEISAAMRRDPRLVAEADQLSAAEAVLRSRLPATAKEYDLTRLVGELSPDMVAVGLGVEIAMLRGVEARCPHVVWPPAPTSAHVAVSLASRTAVCGGSACVTAALRRHHDDGRCELCERDADTFTPFIVPLGPCVVQLELCGVCSDFVTGTMR